MNQITFFLFIRVSLVILFVLVGLSSPSSAPVVVQAKQLMRQPEIGALPASIGSCSLFPDNNIWNVPVDRLPVHARSNQWVNSIGRNTGFHMDFGSGTWDGGPIGIPYNVVGAGVSKVPVSFYYPSESDPGPYPIPANPQIEYGSDHHILIVDNSTCTLYELYDASYSGGQWHAGSGAIWNLNSNALRPDTWTSADAAGLPILPGLLRYDEVASGLINHAIRFTASDTNGYIWPARHLTSDDPNTPYIPPMGARFRLKASFNVLAYPPQMRVILNAMKTYGIILADNGSDWYVSGAPDERWNNDMLHLLDDLNGDDFEAVDTSVLMVNYNSGSTGSTVSGNTEIAGVTLSYSDGSPRTVTSQQNGSYSFPISYNWTGTVTPVHPCFTFTPPSRSYSGVTTNQSAQNFTAAFNPGPGCANLNIFVGGANRGHYGLLPGGSTRQSFAGVNDGPVEIRANNGVPLIGAERVIYKVNGVNTSFSEMMGLPANQLDTIYWLPWYNNVDLDTQLRFANVSGATATVHIFIGDTEVTPTDGIALLPGESTRVSYADVNDGPVKIESDHGVPIVAAERVIYKVSAVKTSFSEMMALPDSQLSTLYWLPWYNNVDLDTQLRIGNVSNTTANVHISIGGIEMGSGFDLPPGESTRLSFPDINSGPVKIESDQTIVAAERVIYKVNGKNTSFSEMMALPNEHLNTTFWLPWYNNVDLDTQLRIANTSALPATVHVYIGGAEMGSGFALPAGESTRMSFPSVNAGPVQIVSDQPIVAAERVIYKVNTINTSFTEMMGLPEAMLDTVYWLPWYNNVDLDTQLRFGVP